MVDMDLVILGVLMGAPQHGYQIKQSIEASFGKRNTKLSNSSLYPRLSRLEGDGYIEGHREAQEKIPDRKVYKITAAGMKRVHDLAAAPPSPREDIFDFRSRAVFFGLLTPEERQSIMKPLFDDARQELDEALEKQKRFGQFMDKYSLAVLEIGIEEIKLKVELCKKLMDLE